MTVPAAQSPTTGETRPAYRSGRLHRIADELPAYAPRTLQGRAPGLSVAIYDCWTDETLSAGYGFADLAREMPMTASTAFRASSISKTLVSTAVSQLIEGGHIDPHAPLNEDMMGFRIHNPRGRRAVTALDLLKYRSGLGTNPFDMRYADAPSLQDYLAGVYASQRASEYGGKGRLWTRPVDEGFAYTSLGMATLGHLVAQANPEGYPYEEYVEQRIFNPLGMASSCVSELHAGDGARVLVDRCATGYMRFGSRCIPSPILRPAGYPALSLLTTVEDFLRWLVAMLRKGRAKHGRLLAPQTVEEMLLPQSEMRVGDDRLGLWYGLGIQMANLNRKDFWFGHGAGYPYGWWSEARAYPWHGFAVVAFCNAWDMMRLVNPQTRIPCGLVADFVASLMTDEGRVVRAPSGQAFGSSYAMGLEVVDRVAMTGARYALGAESLEAMIEGARSLPDPQQPDSWHAGGFRAGVEALSRGDVTGEAIRHFIKSDADVSSDYLDLLALEWGASDARWPGPMPYFTDRLDEDPTVYNHLDALG